MLYQHSPRMPTTGLRERGNDTSRSTGRSGRQNAATRRNMRREERVTVQGPVKKQQPGGLSHKGGTSSWCTYLLVAHSAGAHRMYDCTFGGPIRPASLGGEGGLP